MNNINVTDSEQEGGWFVVQIISKKEIVYSPKILTNQNASQIQIIPNSIGIDILPVRESIKINVSPKINGSGTAYNIKGQFEVYTQSKEIDSYFNRCIHDQVILLAEKHYGQQVVFGSYLCPLEFSYVPIHGTKLEDGQGFKVFVKGEIPQKPVFI